MGSIPAILSDSSVVCQGGPTAHPLLAVISNSGMAIPDSTNTDPPRTKTHLAFAGNLLGLVFLPDQLARALGLMGWMLSLYLVTLGGR